MFRPGSSVFCCMPVLPTPALPSVFSPGFPLSGTLCGSLSSELFSVYHSSAADFSQAVYLSLSLCLQRTRQARRLAVPHSRWTIFGIYNGFWCVCNVFCRVRCGHGASGFRHSPEQVHLSQEALSVKLFFPPGASQSHADSPVTSQPHHLSPPSWPSACACCPSPELSCAICDFALSVYLINLVYAASGSGLVHE